MDFIGFYILNYIRFVVFIMVPINIFTFQRGGEGVGRLGVHDLKIILLALFFCVLVCLVPNPPLNVSLKIVHLSGRGLPMTNWREKAFHDTRLPRKARDVPLTEDKLEAEVQDKEEDPTPERESQTVTQRPLATSESLNSSSVPFVNSVNTYTPTAESLPTNTSDVSANENSTASYWPTGRPSPIEGEYEFVNGVAPEYEDSKELGSGMDLNPEPNDGSNKLPSILLELHWLPPPPPTTTDGFTVYIYRDSKSHSFIYCISGVLLNNIRKHWITENFIFSPFF